MFLFQLSKFHFEACHSGTAYEMHSHMKWLHNFVFEYALTGTFPSMRLCVPTLQVLLLAFAFKSSFGFLLNYFSLALVLYTECPQLHMCSQSLLSRSANLLYFILTNVTS